MHVYKVLSLYRLLINGITVIRIEMITAKPTILYDSLSINRNTVNVNMVLTLLLPQPSLFQIPENAWHRFLVVDRSPAHGLPRGQD